MARSRLMEILAGPKIDHPTHLLDMDGWDRVEAADKQYRKDTPARVLIWIGGTLSVAGFLELIGWFN